ncbi:hypothetical protein TWF718_005359 [Orbilia javanica]|uniref:BTB domain-containing protein n=1 Tax=Orbilia javanica TaxID=47235 RepID=A0AAN8N3G9_9PEZI
MGTPKTEAGLLKLFNNREFADILAKVNGKNGKSYFLHQAIVCPNSNYFAQLCGATAMTGNAKMLTFPEDVRPETFDVVVRWIYGDRSFLENPQSKSHSLMVLTLAKRFGVEELRVAALKKCLEFPQEKAKPNTEYQNGSDEFEYESGKLEYIRAVCAGGSIQDWAHFRGFFDKAIQKAIISPGLLLDIANHSDLGLLAALFIERYNNILRFYICDCYQKSQEDSGGSPDGRLFPKISHKEGCKSTAILQDEDISKYLGRTS